VDPGLLGVGERAFEYIGGGEPGLFVLFGMVGWAGAVWLVAGLAGTIVLMLFVTGGGRPADAGRTAVWAVASALAVCGALAGGGLSMPVPTIAVAVTLGLLPAATGGRLPRAHGAAAVFAFGALLVMLAMAPLTGLVAWAAKEFGLGDTALHVQAGFLATMAFAWLGGARRIRWGLAAVFAVALAGGGAELLQGALSQRTESLGDWVAHLKGCAIGTALYLLCVGARLCESPEAGEFAARTERAGL
jgi:hypothetical protein